MKYNWYQPQLDIILKKLFDIRDAKGKNEIIDSTITIILNASNDNIQTPKTIEELLEKEYSFITSLDFLAPVITSIAHNNQPFSEIEEPDLKLTEVELLELAYEFFQKHTNIKTFEIFYRFWHQRKNHFSFIEKAPKNFGGDILYLPYYQEAFIQIKRIYKFYDITTIAHEYGHAIQYYLNYDNSFFNTLLPFSEIVSTFFEFISAEVYSNTDFPTAGIIYQFNSFSSNLLNAQNLSQEIEFITDADNQKGSFLKMIENSQNIRDIINNCSFQDYPYIVGFLITCNLFMIYLDDPEKAFYLLYELITINAKIPADKYFEELTNLGLTDASKISSYKNHLKRKLNRH